MGRRRMSRGVETERTLLRSTVSFLLTLALTIGAIAFLSTATSAKTDPTAVYPSKAAGKEAAPAVKLSASAEEEDGFNILYVGAFALVLSIPALAGAALRKDRRRAAAAGDSEEPVRASVRSGAVKAARKRTAAAGRGRRSTADIRRGAAKRQASFGRTL